MTPERYLSVNSTDGHRRWRVIGFGGYPECTDRDRATAIAFYRHGLHGNAETEPIPVWDGDVGTWSAI